MSKEKISTADRKKLERVAKLRKDAEGCLKECRSGNANVHGWNLTVNYDALRKEGEDPTQIAPLEEIKSYFVQDIKYDIEEFNKGNLQGVSYPSFYLFACCYCDENDNLEPDSPVTFEELGITKEELKTLCDKLWQR